MTVDKSRHDNAAAGIDTTIRFQPICRQAGMNFVTTAKLLNYIITYDYGPVFNLAPFAIHGDQHLGIIDQQQAHPPPRK